MSTIVYVEQDNGNLKLVAEIEGIDNPALAVDALLDEAPRLKDREFVALVGDGSGGGSFYSVTVDGDEPVNPKRSMTVVGGSGDNGSVSAVAEEEAKPAPRRRGRPPGSQNKATAKKAAPARKPAAKKPAARKPAAKKAPARKPAAKKAAPKKAGGSPFKKSAKGDD